jgi:hypothetical protein
MKYYWKYRTDAIIAFAKSVDYFWPTELGLYLWYPYSSASSWVTSNIKTLVKRWVLIKKVVDWRMKYGINTI